MSFTRNRFDPPTEPVLTGDYARDMAVLIEDRRRVMVAISDWISRLEDKNAIQLSAASITASNGIKFPATQVTSSDANTLDDYEEWSGALGISFGGGTTGITYGAATEASATKIGNRVRGSGIITLTAKGSSTGAAKITGLPWTVRNDNDSQSAPSFYIVNITFTGQMQGFVDINATTITLAQSTEAGVASNLTDTNFANNSQITVAFDYRTE